MASGFPSGHHQKKLGPAPIASFEDLSDELENGENVVTRMPGIMEVTSPATTPGCSLKTPSTPRIDISRASSSSHHEDSNNSRESSPERELLAGIEPSSGSKLNLSYKEDAHDLRSSTEELDLQDPIHAQDLRRDLKKLRRRRDDGTQSEYGGILRNDRERKDSNCSEIILLNISGRTSRLSSVGSQGSGVSGKLSVMSATSSRSPSPHKCLLETSFCGSKPTLADNLIEPSKPETDDLEKILLKREADTTKALIPDNIKVQIVDGNLKPDALDKPRRRGREERKEIFKREVEMTKKILEKVNIEVPIIRKPSPSRNLDAHSSKSMQDVQKPETLDFTDKRKNVNDVLQPTSTISSITGSPKLPRHQKVIELGGSRTPSPSSRKSSFTSLFKGKTDGSSILSPESPTPSSRSRLSITSKIKETTESIRSRSKSRERTTSASERSSSGSKNKNVFTSTLSLFKKRERKKSTNTPEHDIVSYDNNKSIDSIGNLQFKFENDKTGRCEDSIFISLHGDDDDHDHNHNDNDNNENKNYEETALPSVSVSIPLETPTKLLDEYDCEARSGSCIITEASIEHRSSSSSSPIRIKTEAKIESTLEDEARRSLCQSTSKDSQLSKTSSHESHTSVQTAKHFDMTTTTTTTTTTAIINQELQDDLMKNNLEQLQSKIPGVSSCSVSLMSSSSSRDSLVEIKRKPDIVKPKRKNRDTLKAVKKNDNDIDIDKKLDANDTIDIINNDKKLNENDKIIIDELLKQPQEQSKTSSIISDLDHNSSESERDSEIDFIRNKATRATEELPDERKGLFYEESFDEELPYVPTTLPMEKSSALPILPVKERIQEVKTIPIERPRSTTPINPTLLDEFVMQTSNDDKRTDRMKISLPREESFKLKSPRKHQVNTFTEFAGRVNVDSNKKYIQSPSSPPPQLPPLPPRLSSTSSSSSKIITTTATTTATTPTPHPHQSNWINFEEIPERRKTPKRIQTIPRTDDDNKGNYNYVQPEECRCECHGESRRASTRDTIPGTSTNNLNSNSSTTTTRTSSCSSSSNGERPCHGENCNLPNSGDRASIVRSLFLYFQ
ncbi:bromodomain-containing protein DDB_G0270170 isoform X2 [Aphidius gifuensis]|uniref:bromodomain-containing protein DDB_G0270170 isoform X2 n=2 Tax=Aphidius gifuensis TaxID=684658 RepID=UPI001CDCB844|nr:bromodomain-containing protein DDB_G0270170 isoform X2 [Aphidius gifuensis]